MREENILANNLNYLTKKFFFNISDSKPVPEFYHTVSSTRIRNPDPYQSLSATPDVEGRKNPGHSKGKGNLADV